MVPGYGAAKAGVLSLTRNLAVRGQEKVSGNAAPGVTATRMTASMDYVPRSNRNSSTTSRFCRFRIAGRDSGTDLVLV